MGNRKCKTIKKKDFDSHKQKDKKFRCKKCELTSNKEDKLCKPKKNI